jgi:membrane protease YdiL (CAAX protease family)
MMATDTRPAQRPRRVMRAGTELAYVAAFVLAELVGIHQPMVGGLCEAFLLVILVNHYALIERDRRQPLLLALAVVCLYRLLALTPLASNDALSRVVVVGAPVLLATILALRLVRVPLVAGARAGRPGAGGAQFLIALTGLPLSWAAYKIFKPTVAFTFSGPGRASTGEVVLAVVVLAVFSGLAEELLFRGLVHGAARLTFGPTALYVSAIIFGAAYLGTGSVAIVAFVVAVGAFFGWCYERTDSVAGVALAHALISVGVFVVWPSLAGHLSHLHF